MTEKTLAGVGFEVLSVFRDVIQACQASSSETALPAQSVEDQFERFDLWAINLGIHRPGHASLDYRFRDAPQIYQYTLKLLAELKEALCCSKFLQNSHGRLL
jgi:hypothetical protein